MLQRPYTFLLSAFALSLASSSYAENAEPLRLKEQPSHHTDKVLQITPYAWMTGLRGDISPFKKAPTIGVRKSFSEVFEDAKVGGFINIWGRRDNAVFSADIIYVDVKDSAAFGPLPALPAPIPPGTVIEGKANSKQFTAAFQGGYRFYNTPQVTIDALAGGRFWRISNDVTVSAGPLSLSHKEHFSWVDPLVGLRAFAPLTDKLSLQAQANIGGFGVGSEFTWSALGTLNYASSDFLAFSGGYKALNVNYNRSGHTYDVRLHGPVLGITGRF